MTPFNFTTVIISWSPPFTLNGIPILGYDVTIAFDLNETIFVENPTLLYPVKHLDIESNLTVTVVPLNGVGKGKAASIIITLPLLPIPATTQAIPGTVYVYNTHSIICS